MLLDLAIAILIFSAIFRGREIGFVQQFFSTVGFFGGLFIGAWLQPHTVDLVREQMSRSLITLATTLGMAFLFLAIGEFIGIVLKKRLSVGRFNRLDNTFGSVLSVVSILAAVWLSAAVVRTLPMTGIQDEMRNSKIVSTLTNHLPYAPNIVATLGNLVDPNGFPQVFTGREPNLPDNINIPSSSQLAAAVNRDRASVVKITGQGCGGVVEGSGFVVGSDLVATNAHVVAGINKPYATDAAGSHSATPIWFDANLDLAILRVSNLKGNPLPLSDDPVRHNTASAALGYPGGGGFTANPASVLDTFRATGRDVYGRGHTQRQVHEIASNVRPGNSGGPLVTADGTVIGVIFAESTTYNNIGYALAMGPVIDAINQATARGNTVSTGSCAE